MILVVSPGFGAGRTAEGSLAPTTCCAARICSASGTRGLGDGNVEFLVVDPLLQRRGQGVERTGERGDDQERARRTRRRRNAAA